MPLPVGTPDDDTDEAVEQAFAALLSASQTPEKCHSIRQLLESKLGGTTGVARSLLDRMWISTPTDITLGDISTVQGDRAVAVLSYLVERYPEYMGPTSDLLHDDVENVLSLTSDTDAKHCISDAMLTSLTKLLIAPNSDDQVRVATNVNAALLHICKYDHCNYNKGRVAQRMFVSLHKMWGHIQRHSSRELSSGQIRIASLMIDVCLLGDDEFSYSLIEEDGECIMDKLLHLAMGMPNDDPLLQMSALDQIERLTAEPTQKNKAEFLLGNEFLRRGLLRLVGSDGNENEIDSINGPAALRLLTEICRVGMSTILSFSSIEESVLSNFQHLLKGFHTALHQFNPHGELEKLSFIHAVSSLFTSCSLLACSVSSELSGTTSYLTNYILQDRTLLHEWLSLHTRVSQPKLKSAVLCSVAQVLEPTMWNDESGQLQRDSRHYQSCTKPNDAIALQLLKAFSDSNGNRDAIDLLLNSAKSPFIEERLGAYTLFKALVIRGATLQLLLLHNDDSGNISFLVSLLNRDNESTTEGRIAKYQIVHTMMSRSDTLIKGLIPEKMARELEVWHNNGPHYAKAMPWEMATE